MKSSFSTSETMCETAENAANTADDAVLFITEKFGNLEMFSKQQDDLSNVLCVFFLAFTLRLPLLLGPQSLKKKHENETLRTQ